MPRNPVHSSMKASVERADGPSSIQVGISPERYAALVELLPQLSRAPDGLGETFLTEEEAEQIRALGFPATRGEWWVPVLPNFLVQGDGLLECLSDAWADPDPRRLLPEHPEKTLSEIDQEQSVEPDDRISSKDEVRVFGAVQRAGGWINKRKLQQRLWRMRAHRLKTALELLRKRDAVELHGATVHLVATEPSGENTKPFENRWL